MIYYHDIDPVAFYIGPFDVRWYGVMYLVAILLAWGLGLHRAKKTANWGSEAVGDLIFFATIGLVMGGRLGHVLLYNLQGFLEDPLLPFKIRQGGMSFHGGLLGALMACGYFARKYRMKMMQVADFSAPLVPLGLAMGRIGNFINGELWGLKTNGTWGVVFPYAGEAPRHPSQLYECLMEGILLFAVLWWFSRKPRPIASVSGLFLLGYGMARFLVEFVREPTVEIANTHLDILTYGQWLSLPMIIIGLYLLISANQHHHQRRLV